MAVLTPGDVAEHLNIGAADLEEAMRFAAAAEELVAGIVGPLEPVLRTDAVVVPRSGVVVLPVARVASVTVDGTAWARVDAAAGIVSGLAPHTVATVSYLVGWTSVSLPASVRLACLIVTAHLFDTQRGGTMSGPGLVVDDPGPVSTAGTRAAPARALELLRPYALSSLGGAGASTGGVG